MNDPVGCHSEKLHTSSLNGLVDNYLGGKSLSKGFAKLFSTLHIVHDH